MKSKRLFLFASFNQNNVIDSSIVFYVKELSKIGDVIFVMDNDITDDNELDKIKPYTIFTKTFKHGEYDFGSYKYAYQTASDNNLLEKYDFVYMVNDSVYGPFYGIEQYLNKFESSQKDGFGLVYRKHKNKSHLQSWFLGLNKNLFSSDQFHKFIMGVKREENKIDICYKYEKGFTRLLNENNFSMYYSFIAKRREIYNNPKKLFKSGLPFFKKAIINRYNGIFGRQINYILSKINFEIRQSIIQTIDDQFGKEYRVKFLTRNPIEILFRFVQYMYKKGK